MEKPFLIIWNGFDSNSKSTLNKWQTMSVRIEPIIDHESYSVNGKEVYKDSNDNWIQRQELTSQEANAFNNYKKAIINNKAFKKHTKATYSPKK